MKRLCSVLLAALVAGCGVSSSGPASSLQPMSTMQPTVPQIASSGTTDVLGLRLPIDASKWKQVEAGPYKLIAELVDKRCDVVCLQLIISAEDSDPSGHGVADEYYRLNVVNGEFITETDCQAGASAFDEAKKQPSIRIDGETAQVYVNGPCAKFTQGPTGPHQRRRFNWFVPSKHYLVQLVESPTGPTFEEVDFQKLLQAGQWR